MPKPKAENLTEVEQRAMEVLWSAGSGTVSEVLAALDAPKPLAFNTVQTILRILEKKGYVRHREEGRAFRYFALVDKATASRSAVHSVVRRFFGSPGALAVNLVQNENLGAADLARIRRLIADAEARK
ncbi:MAG: BlaI/MecI/CopY family transcriptional regulator [Candidatus Eremiobacteraeota bacterium]|nr:BlaI/MecI/CopY family transcriptional regulator [Candidatus Eremiobacteraeota bacterium]MBC5804286.1 BlaI/MecI/CopY family transcriptional regulator [Candidatus Eremiobacteraeota bacterium]MBC5822059.1 BlaI/MecI/CopY family transcriptional regulator [Candidatus Eremiobacteraeota bacterium]